MHINAGQFKGFTILTRDIPGTRPTSDKVKQAIFNVIGPAVEGKAVLDLYSGFGSLGFEALSRGASSVVFVESNLRCCRVLHENIAKIAGMAVGPQAPIEVIGQDVFRAIPRLEKAGQRFAIVLCDAPYQQAANSKLLKTLANSAILAPSAIVILQHGKTESAVPEEGALKLLRSYSYGETVLSLYKT